MVDLSIVTLVYQRVSGKQKRCTTEFRCHMVNHHPNVISDEAGRMFVGAALQHSDCFTVLNFCDPFTYW